MEKKRLSHAEIIVIILIVGALLAILLPALSRHRETRKRSACAENLKQLGLVLELYAVENKERFPPIDNIKNNFMFDANLLYPEYLSDHMLAMCPADSRWDPDTNFRLISDHPVDGTPKGEVHPDCIADDSYIYLGWMLINDTETEAFFDAYDHASADAYDSNLMVPEGWGNAEKDRLYRLSFNVDRYQIPDIDSMWMGMGSAVVPIIWDRPYADSTKFSHRPPGSNVLYMDGHIEYERPAYIRNTLNMAHLLEERPRERIEVCDE